MHFYSAVLEKNSLFSSSNVNLAKIIKHLLLVQAKYEFINSIKLKLVERPQSILEKVESGHIFDTPG